jgi:magnesium chelatase family protein
MRRRQRSWTPSPCSRSPRWERLRPACAGADLLEVRGHAHARRALEVAAAGGHNLLMIGPPGAGKTMLARRISTILPPLAREEAIQVTQIYSVAGLLPPHDPLVTARPFRAPHHTASVQALVGGGAAPRPGEISLAHLGVLFLDELAEFRRDAVEALRQPLEDGWTRIARVLGSVAFPARCMLLAAMNPCPCGYHGDAVRPCVCSHAQRRRYLRRLSGPLLDRIDLHIDVGRIPAADITTAAPGEASVAVRGRVLAARARQTARAGALGLGALTNATIPFPALRRRTDLRGEVLAFLHQAIDRLGLSPRAFERVLRVAQTIADLEGAEQTSVRDVAEALQYRVLDRALPLVEEAGA